MTSPAASVTTVYGTMPTTIAYAAVGDPADSKRMTFWRRDHRGRLVPWPRNARYGPRLVLADLPTDDQERREVVLSFVRSTITPYVRVIEESIAADPYLSAARFAFHVGQCAGCPRRVQSHPERASGLCVACQHRAPADLLSAMVDATSRLRAATAVG